MYFIAKLETLLKTRIKNKKGTSCIRICSINHTLDLVHKKEQSQKKWGQRWESILQIDE